MSSSQLDATTSLPVYNATTPSIMDREIVRVNSGTVELTSLAASGTTTEDFLTSDQVYYDGTFSVIANNSSKPQLYAPSTWQEGSSISHWDQDYFGNQDNDALMHPGAPFSNFSFHRHIGDVTTAFMRDIGWDLWPTGISINSDNSVMQAYPNPSSTGVFRLQIEGLSFYRIYDLRGNLLIQDNELEIDLSNFSDGFYMLQLITGDNTFSTKLLKSKS